MLARLRSHITNAHDRRGRAWLRSAARVYRPDITYGSVAMRRGHWSDRAGGIDKDILALVRKLEDAKLKKVPASQHVGVCGDCGAGDSGDH